MFMLLYQLKIKQTLFENLPESVIGGVGIDVS